MSSICYQEFLKAELDKRKERNPGYSLRAFARDLDVTVSRLSVVMNRKGSLSTKTAHHLAQQLQMNAVEKAYFLASVAADHPRSPQIRQQGELLLQKLSQQKKFKLLSEDVFKIILEWHHIAILELSETHTFRSDEKWIARRLNITVSDVKIAVQRLLRQKLIKIEKNKWVRTYENLSVESEIPSREMQHYHHQILTKAQNALDQCQREERDFSAAVFSFREDQIVEARAMIKEFRRNLMQKFEASEKKDRVYCLSLQLFPLDKLEKENLEEKL